MKKVARRRSFSSVTIVLLVALVSGMASAVVPPPVSRAANDPACSKQLTRNAFVAFVSAFNRGDSEGLDSIFAREPVFRWYSSPEPGERSNRAAGQRSSLVRFFRVRHADRDRMRLRHFRYNAPSHRWSNFDFALDRRADSFNEGEGFESLGKGAVECSTGRPQIMVISLGGSIPKASKPTVASRSSAQRQTESSFPWLEAGLLFVLLVSLVVFGVRLRRR